MAEATTAEQNQPQAESAEGPHIVTAADPLTLAQFAQLADRLAGYEFVKIVLRRSTGELHCLSADRHRLHAYYIAEHILDLPESELESRLDELNDTFYRAEPRDLYLGILLRHDLADGPCLALETVEVDTMTAPMLTAFFDAVRERLDPAIRLVLKPAHHGQQEALTAASQTGLATPPQVSADEVYSAAAYVPLLAGVSEGRLRIFSSEEEYRAAEPPRWYDIVVMDRIPDDIGRVSGLISSARGTPLSHTNVLAAGWRIPNAIALGARDRLADLDGQWVRYEVGADAENIEVEPIAAPERIPTRPPWRTEQPVLAEPESAPAPIAALGELRQADAIRYGTKAANLGELAQLRTTGSPRLLGYYQVPRPPRPNLLTYLREQLAEESHGGDLDALAAAELADLVWVPRGIALPFAVQREFLESCPAIQQTIGRLKMALELDSDRVPELCEELRDRIRSTRLPVDLGRRVDAAMVTHLAGAARVVVRSSSNAEDLPAFPAAGIYTSLNGLRTTDEILLGVKEVWASLFDVRAVRLRQDAGMGLDAVFMGVLIQEEVAGELGGVLVTQDPLQPADFRTVLLNASRRSVTEVVGGQAEPMQLRYNTVEGSGRTITLGDGETALTAEEDRTLGRFAVVSRLLQAHFCPDYTFTLPIEMEWILTGEQVALVQLRPFAG